MTRTITTSWLGLVLMLASAPTTVAVHRRHHAAPAPTPPAARPYGYYPEDIEGGVPGNLPFNNQIRKHTDPLNANGGR